MAARNSQDQNILDAIKLLNAHYKAFYDAQPFAQKSGHPIPSDTRAWSQILASLLTGTRGIQQKKGADLEDGSDVKAANCWEAIDTPRFNGVIPSGRKSDKFKRELNLSALKSTPIIYFVLWDSEPKTARKRCRVWCVRCSKDRVFRTVCSKWYQQKIAGSIKSDNFQLHPPRNKNSNIIRNRCGVFEMPLLFSASIRGDEYDCDVYDPSVIRFGECILVDGARELGA